MIFKSTANRFNVGILFMSGSSNFDIPVGFFSLLSEGNYVYC